MVGLISDRLIANMIDRSNTDMLSKWQYTRHRD